MAVSLQSFARDPFAYQLPQQTINLFGHISIPGILIVNQNINFLYASLNREIFQLSL